MNGNNDAEDRGFESLVQEEKDEDGKRSFLMKGTHIIYPLVKKICCKFQDFEIFKEDKQI